MSILFNNKTKTFTIQTKNATYIMQVDPEGALRNLHWGDKIEDSNDVETEQPFCHTSYHRTWPCREEYIGRGRTTYDEPCILPVFADGTRDIRLVYNSHSIIQLEKGEKLTVTLRDEHYPLYVDLIYRIYSGLDLISKNTVIRNECDDEVTLTKMKSGTMYTPWARNMRLMYMAGKWAKEYQKKYIDLQQGRFVIDNNRGTSAGPNFVPFFALDEGEATETQGTVWYGTLHWSGNFKIEFEQPYTDQLAVTAGVNDFDCEVILKKDEVFETPVFTIGFSNAGYEKMSETLYDFQFDVLAPQTKVNNIFPMIYNSWYPYEMNVDEKKCLGFIDKAKEVGIELFVIDDGWMHGRKNEHAGLGDWFCDLDKFPNGLKPIADKIHANDMLFGLWVEPEMVNEDSNLYRQHPDWVLQYPTRSKTKFRDQCVLNLARDDVREFVWETVDRLISEFDLDYLKWDMNSYITEAGGYGKDMWVKYTKNLHEIWRRMNEKYPNVLFECCAHGGARSDYGMLEFSDRINRSDNADPIDVLKMHEGFSSYILPKYAGGAGNLATSPNNINGRVSPLKYRAYLGMTGSMSIGVNLLKISQSELDDIKEYIKQYKQIRSVTQNAYVYRLSSAFENPYVVWEYLKRDRTEAVIFVFAHGMNFRNFPPRMRLRGLDPKKKYLISGVENYLGEGEGSPETREIRPDFISGGDALMNFGIKIEPRGDYDCHIIKIKEIK